MKRSPFIFLIMTLLTAGLLVPEDGFPKLSGPYLGQKPPGLTPEIFAPGIVTTNADEYALEIAADGSEILFVRDNAIMLAVRNTDGTWKRPSVAPFSGKHIDDEPCFSPDGKRIFFISRRPGAHSGLACNIWTVDKTNGSWGAPIFFEKLKTTKNPHALSVAASGNIYDDGIIRFQYVNGNYLPAKSLNPPLKGMYPFVAADESYVISSIFLPGKANADLGVSYRRGDGSWTRSVSLGEGINSKAHEGNSFVSADGRYLFFSRKHDIYWVSARIIETLRPKDKAK